MIRLTLEGVGPRGLDCHRPTVQMRVLRIDWSFPVHGELGVSHEPRSSLILAQGVDRRAAETFARSLSPMHRGSIKKYVRSC